MVSKWVRAGISGAIAFLIANIVSNILFFQLGRGILFEHEQQSDKLIAVLFEMEPLPLMFTNGVLYLSLAAGIGVIHGLVFALIEPVLPQHTLSRGLAFAAIVWALMALYFEFHAPFNMFGEPVILVLVELVFWAVVLATEGIILSFGYGASRSERYQHA
ncbi:MAG: hypothetical protein HC837_08595 [Chloroflexaceae bacterium]|nr:hypothetical protein [Chloroflexaceae bacterium]